MNVSLKDIELKDSINEQGIESELSNDYVCIKIDDVETTVRIVDLENALVLFRERN